MTLCHFLCFATDKMPGDFLPYPVTRAVLKAGQIKGILQKNDACIDITRTVSDMVPLVFPSFGSMLSR